MSEIQEKVVAIIADKLSVKPAEITPEAGFTTHLGADSLDTVELIMDLLKLKQLKLLIKIQLLKK